MTAWRSGTAISPLTRAPARIRLSSVTDHCSVINEHVVGTPLGVAWLTHLWEIDDALCLQRTDIHPTRHRARSAARRHARAARLRIGTGRISGIGLRSSAAAGRRSREAVPVPR